MFTISEIIPEFLTSADRVQKYPIISVAIMACAFILDSYYRGAIIHILFRQG